jgi:flavodoxin
MKVLVAYMSSTGNTRKVAEAIYGELDCEKEIKPIKHVQDVGAYDLAFLGFPTRRYGPDKKEKEIIERLCTNGREVALFVTHGAPETSPEAPKWMANFKQAAAGAKLVGFFDCQGQMSKGVLLFMRLSHDKKLRTWAKMNNSQGQPDETRLEKARAFTRDVMNRADNLRKGP